jgi:hypothetical protein
VRRTDAPREQPHQNDTSYGQACHHQGVGRFRFTFQPSLDKDRIFTLAQLGFIARCEAVHFLGPREPVKAIQPPHSVSKPSRPGSKAGKSVDFTTFADRIASRAERQGRLQERIRFFCRPSLPIVDEIGHLPVVAGGGKLFFQLVNARYRALIYQPMEGGKTREYIEFVAVAGNVVRRACSRGESTREAPSRASRLNKAEQEQDFPGASALCKPETAILAPQPCGGDYFQVASPIQREFANAALPGSHIYPSAKGDKSLGLPLGCFPAYWFRPFRAAVNRKKAGIVFGADD